jgi:hypothetical protein
MCGSITPPPSWLCYQSSTLYAVLIRWDGSEFDYPMFAISIFRHPEPGVFSGTRESGQLYLEKCAQTLKESGAIFTLLGRLILGEISVFDDALGFHSSFCQ